MRRPSAVFPISWTTIRLDWRASLCRRRRSVCSWRLIVVAKVEAEFFFGVVIWDWALAVEASSKTTGNTPKVNHDDS